MEALFREIKLLSVLLDIILETIGVLVPGEFTDSLCHLVEVAGSVDMASSTEDKAIHWVEGHESKFFVSIAANRFEDLFDDFRIVEKGRSTVECVTVFLEQAGSSSDCIGFLEDRDVDA